MSGAFGRHRHLSSRVFSRAGARRPLHRCPPIDDSAPGVKAVRFDIRDRAAVERVAEGVAAVVHTAAWHGIHLRNHPARDLWELNADGTFNVFQAATSAGARAVVFSSTMGVYGESSRSVGDESAVWALAGSGPQPCRPDRGRWPGVVLKIAHEAAKTMPLASIGADVA